MESRVYWLTIADVDHSGYLVLNGARVTYKRVIRAPRCENIPLLPASLPYCRAMFSMLHYLSQWLSIL